MFGKWPIQAFDELDPAQKTSFWAADVKSKASLQNLLVTDIATKRIQTEVDRVGGSFLPLSVYKTQGYNVDAIATNCPMRYDDELQEDTYKLTVHSSFEDKIKSEVSNMVASLRDNSLRGKLSHYASPMAKRKRKRSRSSSGSDSSSSSSSSSKNGSPQLTKKQIAAKKVAEAKAAKLAKAAIAKKEAAEKKEAAAKARAAKAVEAQKEKEANQKAKMEQKQDQMHMHRTR